MADLSLKFESGVKTLELTDGLHSCEVTFNPYDVMFLGRIVDTAEQLEAIQKKLQTVQSDDWKTVYDTAMSVDKEMREKIDALFGAPVCGALFDGQTVFAVGDGFPAWSNLLYAVVDSMDTGLSAEKTRAQTRIRKYSEKYRR